LVTLNLVDACTIFVFLFLCKFTTWIPPSLGSCHYSCSWILFVWRCAVNLTNHAKCAELPALWLSAERNCELCQNALHMKEGIWCTFWTTAHFGNNFNSKYNRAFLMVTYLDRSEYFENFSPNNTKLLYKHHSVINWLGE
jgi:hypothetical protein